MFVPFQAVIFNFQGKQLRDSLFSIAETMSIAWSPTIVQSLLHHRKRLDQATLQAQ